MSEMIDEIFSSIADKYDVLGHIFSFGIDGLWRKMTAREAIIEKSSYKILDVATGTGSLAIDIARKAKKNKKTVKIIAVDFNKDMLYIAKKKIDKMNLQDTITVKTEDAMKLEEPDCCYDVVSAGFLLRNVDDVKVFAGEMRRILKIGGKFILLEMGKTDNLAIDLFFKIYFSVLRRVGSIVDKRAYLWLTHSIMVFDKNKMVETLKSNGFSGIKIKNLPFGIGFIITGIKAS